MLRTIVTPDNQNVSIHVPQEYVGKQIEVLLYATDEIKPEVPKNAKTLKPSDFAGTLSKKDALKLLKDVEQSRNEWERGF